MRICRKADRNSNVNTKDKRVWKFASQLCYLQPAWCGMVASFSFSQLCYLQLDVGWLLVLVLVARVQMRANVNGPPLAWFEWPQTNWSNYNSAANLKLGRCSSKYESSLFSPRRRDQLTSADVLHNCVENLPIHIMTSAVWSSCWECIRVKNGRCCVNFTRKQGLWCTAVQHVALMFQI